KIDSEQTFAYQLLAGLSFKLDPRTHLFTEFRYFGTANNVYNSAIDATGSYSANNIIFGVRFGL
ncbi:MAG: hypothetical protein AAGF97_11185, partial [Planctomycetota bacterium]